MFTYPHTQLGIVGTGFVSKGLTLALQKQEELAVSRILTRRSSRLPLDHPCEQAITRSVDDLIDHADLIVECSGDVVHATNVIDRCLAAGKPVVTMNAEFQVTVGSYFAGKGICTEAEGDQPGCLAALREEAVEMGFEPLVYGNTKGFLNLNPTLPDMEYWAARQGISLEMVTSFTDGTKVQIEQALVANGLGAGIVQEGLLGPQTPDLATGAFQLAEDAERLGHPVSDFVVTREYPGSVFMIARHQEQQQPYLQYLKLGSGPHYLLVRNFHLVHLEITKTIKRVLEGKGNLLDNSATPHYSVAAVAKRDLAPGESIDRGVGSFAVRGETVVLRDHPEHVPIGLLQKATIERPVAQGDVLSAQDVTMGESLATHAWEQIKERVLDAESAVGVTH